MPRAAPSNPAALPPDHGLEEGQVCGRGDACPGILETAAVEGCSCHINPPCSACTEDWTFCPECGWEAENKIRDYVFEPAMDARTRHDRRADRSDCYTRTHTAGPFNNTPFTDCCGTAAINCSRCPSCNAEITGHDDGLAARRREVGPNHCLMCGKRCLKRGEPLGTPGTCCC